MLEVGNGTHVLAIGLHKFINRVILIMGRLELDYRSFTYLGSIGLGNGPYVLGNGTQVLGNGNGLPVL